MLAAHEPSRLSATETLLYSERDLSVPDAMSKRNSTISTGSSDSREGSFDARHYDESLRMQKIKQEPIFTSEIKQEPEED